MQYWVIVLQCNSLCIPNTIIWDLSTPSIKEQVPQSTANSCFFSLLFITPAPSGHNNSQSNLGEKNQSRDEILSLISFLLNTITVDIMLKWQKQSWMYETIFIIWSRAIAWTGHKGDCQIGLLFEPTERQRQRQAMQSAFPWLLTMREKSLHRQESIWAVAQSGSSSTPAADWRNLRGIKETESQWSTAVHLACSSPANPIPHLYQIIFFFVIEADERRDQGCPWKGWAQCSVSDLYHSLRLAMWID